MADSDYQAWVEVLPDLSSFNRTVTTGIPNTLGAAGVAGAGAFGTSFIGGVGKFAAPIAGAIAALGIGQLVGNAIGAGINYSLDAIDFAAGLAEQQNAVTVAFADYADEVLALGKDAPKSLNLTQAAFAKLAVRFSSQAKTIAGAGGDVSAIIDQLTTRGADFASVYDLEASNALELFQSGLSGETEPLRRFGIDLSAAAVEAYAFANGIGDGTGELTEAEKVQARYGALLEQTAIVQGDLANTAGSYANQQREFATALEEAQTKFGEALLPVATDILGWGNDTFLPALTSVLDEVGPDLAASLEDAGPELKAALGTALELAPGAFSFITDEIVKAVNDVNNTVTFFDDPLTFFENGETNYEVRSGFQELGNFLAEAGSQFEDLVAGVNTQKDPFDRAVIDFLNAPLNDLTAWPGLFYNAGDAAARGLAQGIRDGRGHAILAANELANEVVGTLRSAMQIASPSKVTQELGLYVAEGFALGITDGVSGVRSAVTAMTELPDVSQVGSSGASASGSGVRDVHFHTEDPVVAFTMFKQEIGGELAIR